MKLGYFAMMTLMMCFSSITFAATATTSSSVNQSNVKKTSSSENTITPVNRIVAVVNDAVITQLDLDKQIAFVRMEMTSEGKPLPDNINDLSKQVLNQYIDHVLQLQIAKKQNIAATSGEISAAINRITGTSNANADQFYKQAAQYGISRRELRDNIRDQIIIQKLEQRVIAQRVNITDQDVDNYMHQYQLADSQQADTQYHVEDILITLPASPSAHEIQQAKNRADVLVNQLKSGADFTKLALAQSDSPTTLSNHGDLGWRTFAELPDVFIDHIKKMKQGDIAGPIRTANGFHIIKLAGIRNSGASHPHKATQLQIEQIVLKPDAKQSEEKTQALAKKLSAELQRGGNFSELAKNYSQGEHASNGGFVGWKTVNTYPKQVAEIITKLKPGEVSPPITIGKDYYLIKVLGQRQATVIDNNTRAEIEQQLYQRDADEVLQTWIGELRAQAYVKEMLQTET
ncbi:MAG: peptidylprolyl isomerase [Pseudomonadota bacterium]